MLKMIYFPVFSGICASAASTFGKLAWLPILEGYFFLRVLFFICMIICNGGVWTLFVKALHYTNSSLTATVVSSASNYAFSALTGFLLFKETTSLLWWSGMFFIIIGLSLVVSSGVDASRETISEEKK